MNFQVEDTFIEGLKILTPKLIKDQRGHFLETYKLSSYKDAGIEDTFVQSNESLSNKNVLRGIHYQVSPWKQGKLVRVIKGSVLDVAVDLREDSPTYCRWFSVELSEDNFKLMYIPPGFGHGFLSLEDKTIFSYLCTAEYNCKSERGIIWNDPSIGIDWAIKNPILSDKDRGLPKFQDTDCTGR